LAYYNGQYEAGDGPWKVARRTPEGKTKKCASSLDRHAAEVRRMRSAVRVARAALTRRDARGATDIYAAAFRSPDLGVRSYSRSALAVAGDEGAWGEVIAILNKVLQRKISLRGWRWREV